MKQPYHCCRKKAKEVKEGVRPQFLWQKERYLKTNLEAQAEQFTFLTE